MLIKLILVKPEKKYISKKANNALWVRHTNADVWGKSARRLTTAWDSMCVSICLWKKTKSALHQWQQESLLFDSSPSRYWFSDGSERIWEKDHGGSYYYMHHMYTLTLYSFIYIYFFSSVFFFCTRLGWTYTIWTESMPGIWSRNFSSWLRWKARASFIISEGQLGHVATCIALAGSLHCVLLSRKFPT